jgi:hypothetical protein
VKQNISMICQISPRLNALIAQENVSSEALATKLNMHPAMLRKMLANPNQIWPWVTLSKILWALGYKIEGLRLSKIEAKQ